MPPRPQRFWRAFYDRVAFAYDATLSLGDILGLGSELRIREELFAKLELPANARVLEIGCGTGANRSHLPATANYLGLDISRQMLRRAAKKTHPRSSYAQADAIALPVVARCADLLLAMGVLQHIDTPANMLSEIERSAAAGAQVLLVEERRAAKQIAQRIPGGNHSDTLEHKISSRFTWELLNKQIFGEYFVLHYKVTH
jgi:ubiquinone/menaquinone biosynthesis C-methylase UbiE